MMNTFEKCKTIRSILLKRASEVMTYHKWRNEFAVGYIRSIPEDIRKMSTEEELFAIHPEELTTDQLLSLEFGRFHGDNSTFLIPLWLLPFLADEIKVTSIFGEKMILKKEDIDNDNRAGYLAYGVTPIDFNVNQGGLE